MALLFQMNRLLFTNQWVDSICQATAQGSIPGGIRDTIPFSYDWSQEIFYVHVPIDTSTHYPALYTVGLHC